jgi:hypothetical protein
MAAGGAGQRLGPITKQGSGQVRFLLGQLVLHVLKRDARMRAWSRGNESDVIRLHHGKLATGRNRDQRTAMARNSARVQLDRPKSKA